MKRLHAFFLALLVLYILWVVYVGSSISVSNVSKGEFNFLFEVNSTPRVVVQPPYSLTLSSGVYPGENLGEGLEDSLRKETTRVLQSLGIFPDFRIVEPLVLLPGEKPPERIDEPLVIFFVPFYGYEDRGYYETCHASILVYMSSSGDVGSYLSVEKKYSGGSSKTDDLKYFADDLFRTAKARADVNGSPYSLKVVYWNVLEVRRGKLSDKSCWDVLAGEVGKEIQEWARTLRPSDEP